MDAAPNRLRGCGLLLAAGLAIAGLACVSFVLAIGCFYVEEDARGAAAWKKAVRDMEAQGFSPRNCNLGG